ncbi:hypothetical protein Y032_0006g3113 [Ancylostoma ceylanicum]|nr:hypothetical protein Y032_0006g3113 [Ancylostoma ceylanicum]
MHSARIIWQFCRRDSADHVTLQSAIDAIYDWSAEWKLPLSITKTKLFHLGRSNSKYTYFLDGKELNNTDTICDLGFTLNTKLNFDEHCNLIAKKAERTLNNIFKSLSTNSANHLLLAYKSYVRPILEYGTTVFNPKSKNTVMRLESVQNSFTRKLWIRLHGYNYANIPSASVRNRTFKIPSLATRRIKRDLVMIYKIICGKNHLSVDKFFRLSPSCTRGGPFKIEFSTAKNSLRSNFFTQRAGSIFLRFSKKCALPCSLNQYKRQIDKYLRDSTY